MSRRVDITKGKVGASSLGGYEKIAALVGYFGTAEGAEEGLALDTPIEFSNVNELEIFGITPESKPLLYHHISEFFRMGGSGTRLHVLSLTKPAETTFAEMINAQAVKTLIANANGNIFQIGFCYVPDGVPAYVDGLHSETVPAIIAAQAFADWCRTTDRPLHVILEGAMYNAPAASAQSLRNITQQGVVTQCPNVSLVIGQDWQFADTLAGNEQKYAAVGTVLGCMAAQIVSYNIGEVATMGLTDAVRGKWIVAGLSNHTKVKEVESEIATLNEKGYIFGEYYTGVVCFNDDHTCTPVIVDDEGNMNEHSIAISRTNAKVFREIFRIYEPKVKSTPPVDAKTGLLGIGMIKYYEGFGNNLFLKMQGNKELSGGETKVDPTSNLLFGDKELRVSYNWVPMGVVARISGTVNIRRSLV